MGGAVAAIVAAKQKQIVEAFRAARATSVNTGRSLADVQVEDSRLFRGLLSRGILREASPGTYYVDEVFYAADTKRRQAIALVVAGIVLIAGIALALWKSP